MGQVDDRGEVARGLRLSCKRGRGRNSGDKSAPRHRVPHRLAATGNAHETLRPRTPRSSQADLRRDSGYGRRTCDSAGCRLRTPHARARRSLDPDRRPPAAGGGLGAASDRRACRPGRPQRHRQDHAVPRDRRRDRRSSTARSTCRRAPAIGRLAQEAPGRTGAADRRGARRRQGAARPARRSRERADPHRIAEIQTRLADIGAHAAPARAAAILAGLGFGAEAQQRPCTDFSGGWRMRVALAAVLFSEPDLLLLDEPTNYLDLEGTLWLTDHLARYPRSVIVISHDRDLLDDAVDWILHLEGGKLDALPRRLYGVRAARARRSCSSTPSCQEAGGGAQAPAGLRRPLQGQGLEGAPGAVARQAARQARAGRGGHRATRCGRSISRTPAKELSPPIIALDKVSVGYEPGRPVLRRLIAAHRHRRPHRAARRRTATASRRWQSCSPAGCSRSTARSRVPTASRSRISRSTSSTS